MYGFLAHRLPAPWPSMLTALWYALLIGAIALRIDLPDAPFRYLGM